MNWKGLLTNMWKTHSTDSDDFYNATVGPHLLSEGAKPLGGKQPRNVVEWKDLKPYIYDVTTFEEFTTKYSDAMVLDLIWVNEKSIRVWANQTARERLLSFIENYDNPCIKLVDGELFLCNCKNLENESQKAYPIISKTED